MSRLEISTLLVVMSSALFNLTTYEQSATPSLIGVGEIMTTCALPLMSPSSPDALGYPLYHGNANLPEIALTFDDGPNPPYTSRILTILKNNGVKATFFVIGSQAATHPDLVLQEFRQGNSVGNHTWTHPNLLTLRSAQIRSQLQSTSLEIRTATGVTPTLFRPPGGNFSHSVQSIAASLGLSTILWNVDPRDWSRPGTNVIIQRVLGATYNGSIIIMHDGGGDRSETVAALPTIISTLVHRGFRFVTIPHLIADVSASRASAFGQAPFSLYCAAQGLTRLPTLDFSPRDPALRRYVHPNVWRA